MKFPAFVSAILAAALPASAQESVGAIERYTTEADSFFAPDAVVEKLTQDRFGWSEGPVWMEERAELLFTDVPGNTLYSWSEEDGLEIVLHPSGLGGPDAESFREPGANGLISDGPHAVLMGDHGNRAVVRLDLATLEKSMLVDTFEDKRFSSPNDLVRASDGRLYFTDPPYGLKGGDASPLKEMDVNGVYLLRLNGELLRIENTLTRPNGVALSPDERTLYVSQSEPAAAHLYAYDLDASGVPTGRRLLADFTPLVEQGEPGLPDGMAITRDGYIFLAGPGGIHLLSPDGGGIALIRTGTAAANVTLTEDERFAYVTSGAFLARARLRAR